MTWKVHQTKEWYSMDRGVGLWEGNMSYVFIIHFSLSFFSISLLLVFLLYLFSLLSLLLTSISC